MEQKKFVIGTLGSHSALQILKGAKDEGFTTLLVTIPKHKAFYSTLAFIDEIIVISSFSEFPTVEKELIQKNVIVIPHGSFVAYLGGEVNRNMKVKYYGNKAVLNWEEDREKQREWLGQAGINLPRHYDGANEAIKFPIIAKSYGAAGGKGYFYAKSEEDFEIKLKRFKNKEYIVQEYVIGVPLYVHFFYSPLTDKLEIMSMDRRYETNVDGLGRIPFEGQEGLHIEPSYVVVGNSDLVLREGMLSEIYNMATNVISTSKKIIDKRGLFGPFCIETIITPDQQFYVVEMSCRIVAGTNLFINGSPYSWLYYNEPMSTGRRIAREIKNAIKENKLEMLLD